ncbi:hypothetical protein HK097_001196 [Rhizophlyctis rosea]|uniref:Aminodeoxychorismate synthase n=1 Tax=Rhizophlyctis rosea TaxID=64517 RepID=A0AAD5X0Y0_9FUNG|nr:hypothetical protein HK097_001196 [Rhizophlyctis rosea]
MGCADGPHSFKVTYNASTRTITESRPQSQSTTSTLSPGDTFFAYLARIVQSHNQGHQIRTVTVEGNDVVLPFGFKGGLVGYFGYEMKGESLGAKFQHESAGNTPDAAFMFVDRFVVFDHIEGGVWAVAIEWDGEEGRTKEWFEGIGQVVRDGGCREGDPKVNVVRSVSDMPELGKADEKRRKFSYRHPRATYLSNIAKTQTKINDGESYEICLTTQLRCSLPSSAPDAFTFYTHLRKTNPAPYSAYLAFSSTLHIASSSPERFMKVDADGMMDMKPIKGTVARGATPEEDERRRGALGGNEKDRAENLMIVDLIRNDLNTISRPNTVHVPKLMAVESYATVHQLVSTIRGHLRPELTAIDAIMRSFPPGSMTGAPKLRTVEIMEELEGAPRGVYSGVLGWIGIDGAAEMSVVIRTAVFDGKGVSVGAGGAIIALSNDVEEWKEVETKLGSCLPSLTAVYAADGPDPEPSTVDRFEADGQKPDPSTVDHFKTNKNMHRSCGWTTIWRSLKKQWEAS